MLCSLAARLEALNAYVTLVDCGLHFEKFWLDCFFRKTLDICIFVSLLLVGTFPCLEEFSLSCLQDVCLAASILGAPLGKKAESLIPVVSTCIHLPCSQQNMPTFNVFWYVLHRKTNNSSPVWGWERARKQALWRLGRAYWSSNFLNRLGTNPLWLLSYTFSSTFIGSWYVQFLRLWKVCRVNQIASGFSPLQVWISRSSESAAIIHLFCDPNIGCCFFCPLVLRNSAKVKEKHLYSYFCRISGGSGG